MLEYVIILHILQVFSVCMFLGTGATTMLPKISRRISLHVIMCVDMRIDPGVDLLCFVNICLLTALCVWCVCVRACASVCVSAN